MIGTITAPDGRVATMNDQGNWESDDAETVETLELLHGLGSSQPGDHHQPFGVARLLRAANDLGWAPHVAVEPYGPLPEGVVS